jgi:hypothetical protein
MKQDKVTVSPSGQPTNWLSTFMLGGTENELKLINLYMNETIN